ncbi:DUF1764-domain-containing protein [Epithele typhae]|uniref:DUF1764-domain-containing protein n=1 Tax=Epithele typhae TaxID=378194 RepID=UPI0020072BED|nr:DUF1764-domain-containing protein [Epithele typhae]KAH9944482.1 DUF1764-domain-containing protein [Epithele typhae]
MPPSEIDAIFASKPKAAPPKASTSSIALLSKKKDKAAAKPAPRASGKRKREDDASAEDAEPSKPPKRQVPETVFGPSSSSSKGRVRSVKAAKPVPATVRPQRPKKDREEDDRFKDSRGTGPRRKTEEGFAIYKEDELGITAQGGDTPLCPFDCQCCEYITTFVYAVGLTPSSGF